MLCQKEATLIYMANLGCIEINPWNAKISSLDKLDCIVVDLDPSDKNDFKQVVEVAQAFYELLKELKIDGYCKTARDRPLRWLIVSGPSPVRRCRPHSFGKR